MKKVITIGEILVEIMATETGDGFAAPIALIGPYPSGAPAIFIDQVARLGQPCGLIGAVGDDDFGRLNVDRLRRDGVDVSAITVDPDRPTGSAFVRYRSDGTRDFVYNIRHSASGVLAPSPAADALVAAADHLHVMGTALASPALAGMVLDALRRIKARGGTVSFDPNLRKEMLSAPGLRAALAEVLAATDVFLPSGDELLLFSDTADEAHAVAELLARGISHVVIKRGAAGATCATAGDSCTVPGLAVTEADPTGAGDAFGGAFVTCWLRGLPDGVALARANAAGALAVTRRGPMEGTSTGEEIDRLLRSQGAAG